jgi:UDP-galactopyranose mutase
MLGCDARSRITVASARVALDGHPFDGTVVFTRAINEFFDRTFGVIPCWTFDFVFESHSADFYHSFAQMSYTVD